jgi:predicted transporter
LLGHVITFHLSIPAPISATAAASCAIAIINLSGFVAQQVAGFSGHFYFRIENVDLVFSTAAGVLRCNDEPKLAGNRC